MVEFGYDLLKIYYLCGSNNSLAEHNHSAKPVVICLKFTTFVVATTICASSDGKTVRCDLLKIYYLCGSNNSRKHRDNVFTLVVICLKFTTFVVATTVAVKVEAHSHTL